MLKSINRAARPHAHRLLQCLTVAVRPLRLEELAEVLAFDFDEAPGGIPPLNADWRREDQERAVFSTCSSLITVVGDGDSRVVQFSHFSVKEFLTSDRLAVAAKDISFHHIALAPAHTILAQACLGVLLRPDTTSETFVQRFPLANYAVQYWVDHAQFDNVSSHIKDGIESLFDPGKPHFSRWILISDDMDGAYSWPDRTRPEKLEAVSLYHAAFCGFPGVIEKLVREHPEHVNSRGGKCGAALHAAARMNHLNIVQSLVRHGADVDSPGGWGRTPLVFASVWGHLEVERWLLEHGADVSAKDADDDWTSLYLAVGNGRFETVRILLKHNADINSLDNSQRTPLHLASINGRVDIVRLLLDHGPDLEARDGLEGTSLHKASFSGKLDIARLLLEHGADADAKDRQGKTAYQIALDEGHDDVAQLLRLAQGAEYGASSGTMSGA